MLFMTDQAVNNPSNSNGVDLFGTSVVHVDKLEEAVSSDIAGQANSLAIMGLTAGDHRKRWRRKQVFA